MFSQAFLFALNIHFIFFHSGFIIMSFVSQINAAQPHHKNHTDKHWETLSTCIMTIMTTHWSLQSFHVKNGGQNSQLLCKNTFKSLSEAKNIFASLCCPSKVPMLSCKHLSLCCLCEFPCCNRCTAGTVHWVFYLLEHPPNCFDLKSWSLILDLGKHWKECAFCPLKSHHNRSLHCQ